MTTSIPLEQLKYYKTFLEVCQHFSRKFMQKNQKNFWSSKLLDWFAKHKRKLPFRDSKNPYYILVSEIMAQQTQIKTLIPYFNRFISVFPTIEDLAQADIEDVLSQWEGLGYYNRARNLKKAAMIIVKEGFPRNYSDLLNLPGIGPYTAGAIASICFNERVPAIDGNVLRVMSRLYGSNANISEPKTKNYFSKELSEIIPEQAGDFNQALMELGALICLPTNPKCLICPLNQECLAYRLGKTGEIPVKIRSKDRKVIKQEALLLFDDQGLYYINRENQGLLASLNGFPLKESYDEMGKAAMDLAKSYGVNQISYLGHSKHTFTHVIWETDVYAAKLNNSKDKSLTRQPHSIPTAFKKMAKLYYKRT